MDNKKIIFETQFGSVLYGTNTPSSDTDIKGVYMEDLKSVVLRVDRETIHLDSKVNVNDKNKPEDVDIEYIELRKFLEDCMNGQTYALDMLFSPENMWLKVDPIWRKILEHRTFLLSKNVEPYIGYCRTQAGKYGLKGSRLGELLKILNYLKGRPPKARLEKEAFLIQNVWFKDSEFVEIVELEHHHKNGPIIKEKFLKVLGKHFPLKNFIKDVIPPLELMNEKYGQRARLAQENNGIDWKAISHAYRCMYQLEELANTGKIEFPLKDRDYLKVLKTGGVDYKVVQDELPDLMKKSIDAVLNSGYLAENPVREFWEAFIVGVYREYWQL